MLHPASPTRATRRSPIDTTRGHAKVFGRGVFIVASFRGSFRTALCYRRSRRIHLHVRHAIPPHRGCATRPQLTIQANWGAKGPGASSAVAAEPGYAPESPLVVRRGPVRDLLGDQRRVRDDHIRAFVRADGAGADTDPANVALHVADLDGITDLHRSLEEDDRAGDVPRIGRVLLADDHHPVRQHLARQRGGTGRAWARGGAAGEEEDEEEEGARPPARLLANLRAASHARTASSTARIAV